VGSLDSPERKLVSPVNSNAIYASGYLLFMRDRSLMTQHFNLKTLQVEGDAVPLDEKVLFTGNYSLGGFSASNSDVLVDLHETDSITNGEIVWYDRSGKVLL
jgi:hypothetical protein